jgi:tetratricopeptide (TPR) repeat protein
MQGRQHEAIEEFQAVLRADPIDPAALVAVLDDYRRRGAVDDAIRVGNRALELSPANFPALDGLAWAYIQQGEHDLAKDAIERALAASGGLDCNSAFRGFPRLILGALRLAARFPGLRSHLPTLPPTTVMAASATQSMAEWKSWALEYLAWYEREHPSGAPGAHH